MIYDSLMNSFKEYLNEHHLELSENGKMLSEDLLLALSRAFTECAYSTKNFNTLERIKLDDMSFDVYVHELCMNIVHVRTGVITLQLRYINACYSIEHYDKDIADEFYCAEGYTDMDYEFNERKNLNACKIEMLEHELKTLRNEMNCTQEDY